MKRSRPIAALRMLLGMAVALVALCMPLASGSIAFAQQLNPCNPNTEPAVYLYSQTNFTGNCVKLIGDVYDLGIIGFDGVTQSVLVVGGYRATLFSGTGFRGDHSTFLQSDPDIGDRNIGLNRASSARVSFANTPPTPPPSFNNCDGQPGVYLFSNPNFSGDCRKFVASNPDLRTVAFDDVASSIRIVGNWSATLAQDLNGTGVTTTFTTDNANLAGTPIGDNQATSIIVQQLAPPAGAYPCDGQQGVYLYELTDYAGRCIRLTQSVPDLRTVGFDDLVSSIQVRCNCTAILWSDLNFTGRASSFTSDNPNLAPTTIGTNQATSVQITGR